MCGRFVIFDEAEAEELRSIIDDINRKYNQPDSPKLKTGEIFPTDHVPILAVKNDKRVIGLAKWGFPNFKTNGVIINARCETLEEKPSFKKILYTNRCIIPASGYYEWKQAEGKKEKYLIRTNEPVLYMAGLYNSFVDKNNIPYMGFVVITTEPNIAISHIHNRMPAILQRDKINSWLTSNHIEDIKGSLAPYRSENTIVELAAS